MYGVAIALIPALLVSLLFFGLGALKVSLFAVLFCVLTEFLIQKFLLKEPTTIADGSAIVTGLLLAFNLPSNFPIWMILIGAIASIGIGKMSFGGIGRNPFNPALVGRVFLLISFPVEMTSWPKPEFLNFASSSLDGTTGATALGFIKSGLSQGQTVSELMAQMPSLMDHFLGQIGGCIGEVSALAIILGGIYMLYKKIITWHIPLSYLASVFVLSGILNLANGDLFAGPLFHLASGGLMLGAFFMATDMVTSPMSTRGMIVFGLGCGILTVLIRNFGAYPEGVSFAILIMNAAVPIINSLIKPKRYGVA
jgi:electron transport complex protein RnfD